MGLGDEGFEGGVGAHVKAAWVVHAAVDVDVGIHGAVDGFEADHVAVDQGHFFTAVEHVGEVPFEEFFFAVHVALNLDEVGVHVLGEATGVADEVGQGFLVEHFIGHGAFHGALDAHQLVGHGDVEDVVVLQVEVVLHGGVAHKGVEVHGAFGGTADVLDAAYGTDGGGAAGG